MREKMKKELKEEIEAENLKKALDRIKKEVYFHHCLYLHTQHIMLFMFQTIFKFCSYNNITIANQ